MYGFSFVVVCIDAKRIKIIEEHAFGESILNINPCLAKGKWQLLKPDGTPVIKNVPTMRGPYVC